MGTRRAARPRPGGRPRPIDAAAFRRALFAWYEANARRLPWRAMPGEACIDPWRILVSEFMLQQTTVATVLPRYERFLAQFPTPATLAAAPEEAVLGAWSGLGYYARARRLREVAGALAAAPAWPATSAEWRLLPGIGDYTAAAISSLTLGEASLALDTNLLRVIARLTAETRPPDSASVRRALRDDGLRMMDPARPGDFNQAMMDLGALVCVPRVPRCAACPVVPWCAAQAAGIERSIPVAPSREAPPVRHRRDVALAIVRPSRRGPEVLLWRREDVGVYAGMWELPTWRLGRARAAPAGRASPASAGRAIAWFFETADVPDTGASCGDLIPSVKHTLTTFRIALDLLPVRLGAADPLLRRRAATEFAFSNESDARGQWEPLDSAVTLVQATPQRQLVARLAGDVATAAASSPDLAGFYGLRPSPRAATVRRPAR